MEKWCYDCSNAQCSFPTTLRIDTLVFFLCFSWVHTLGIRIQFVLRGFLFISFCWCVHVLSVVFMHIYIYIYQCNMCVYVYVYHRLLCASLVQSIYLFIIPFQCYQRNRSFRVCLNKYEFMFPFPFHLFYTSFFR